GRRRHTRFSRDWSSDVCSARASAPPRPAMSSSTAPASASVVHTLYGETMGTRWRVDLVAPRDMLLHPLHAALQARLDAIVAQMSTWRDDSDLMRYNRGAPGRSPRPATAPSIPPSAAWSALGDSGPMPGRAACPIRGSWRRHAARPDGGGWSCGAARASCCSRAAPGSISRRSPRATRWTRWRRCCARGIPAALVDVGGELRGYGRKPDGAAWRVLVEAGGDDTADPCVVVLDDAAVATSGPYWQRYEV